MTDSSTNQTNDGGAVATTTPANNNGLFATKAEAEATRPANASKALRAFQVTKGTTILGWCLARGHANAIEQVARAVDAYSASTGQPKAAVTVEAAAAKVLEMDDAQWKALLAARKAAGKKI
jgi:hypothetical protein